MNISRFGRAFGLWVAIALLPSCGGLQPPVGAPSGRPQSVTEAGQHAPSAPLLYVSNDGDQHDVTVYPAGAKNPNPIEVISSHLEQPVGICLDRQGTLYVADVDGWVAEYPDGKKTPSRIITKGINVPDRCAVDSKGNLWVTNIYGPNVTEYLKGSAEPHSVVTNGIVSPRGIAFDHVGNMYVSNYLGDYEGNVVVYPPGEKAPSRTISDGVNTPVGIAVDANGTLYVANSVEDNIEEYRFSQSDPYQTVTDSMNAPVAVTVNKQGWLYVDNLGEDEILEFAPGSVTPSGRRITKGLEDPWGTAYSPPLLPKR